GEVHLMSFQQLSTWVRRVLGGKQQRPGRRPSRKLRLELLESRFVPTNLNLVVNLVNNTGLADDAISVVAAGGTEHYNGSSWVPNPEGTLKSTTFSHFSGLMNHQASVVVPPGLDGGIIDVFLGTDVHLVSGANHRVGSPSPYDRQPGTGNPIPQFQEAE